MHTITAIFERHSVRAFLDKQVDPELILELLDIAACAPSGANTQPWQVAVVMGDSKQTLTSALSEAFEQGEPTQPDYIYYPEKWVAPYQDRRKACGLQLYQSLAIERQDKVAQKAQWAANYHAFDAPVLLLFFLDNHMQTGSFLDLGMFLQSFMLAAESLELGTCPQAAFADYPQLIKAQLGYPEDSILVCGMALGYEDKEAAVNQYRTPREPAKTFTRFFD